MTQIQKHIPSVPAQKKSNPPHPQRSRWFEEGELICSGPGCSKKMPAGYHGVTKRIFLCSSNCTYKYHLEQRTPVRCTFCRKSFTKKGRNATRPFCSPEHWLAWRKAQLDREKAGRFTRILHEYLETYAPRHYAPATLNALRCNLASFFSFLRGEGIRSLNKVTPQIVSRWLTQLSKTRKKSAGSVAGCIRIFFDWLTLTGRRKAANPVLTRIHAQRRAKHLPRPYDKKEMTLIWRLLEESGDQVLKTAVALGQEAGLRIGEVCNLRVQDVDLERQELFIRLPNKTNQERKAPFHTQSLTCLTRWLGSRGDRDHDFLFVSPTGKPLKSYNLRKRLRTVLQGPEKLARFEFHRLRHTAATRMINGGAESAAVMHSFGWRNPAVMTSYARLLPENVRASYDKAMRKEQDLIAPKRKLQSLDEFTAKRPE